MNISIISCSNRDNQVSFKIWNSNDNYINNLVISNGVNEVVFDTILPHKTIDINLNFKNVPKKDGGYKLSYKLNSEEFFKNFGYYSNGIPTNSIYLIKIKKDTILINEEDKR